MAIIVSIEQAKDEKNMQQAKLGLEDILEQQALFFQHYEPDDTG